MEASFIEMRKDLTGAVPSPRDMGSPTLGLGDPFMSPPRDDRDPKKKSSDTKSVYSVHSDGTAPPSYPASNRSTVRSVFLVLSCAGSMIINVSGTRLVCPRGVDHLSGV